VSPTSEGAFVIVIGRGHSGTRVLSHTLLGSGVYLGKWLNPAGDKIPGDQMYEAARAVARHVGWDGELAWDFTRLHSMPVEAEFEAMVEEYLRDVIEIRRPRKGWKLPESILAYPWVVRLFPDAHYIHIVRDPRDCLLGSHLTDDLAEWNVPCPETEDVFERRVASWKYQYEIVEATPRPGRFLMVRYEDLVLEQEEALRRLEEFVGFPLARVVVDPSRIGKWKHDPAVLPYLEPLASHMRELGYDPLPARVAAGRR
jgi:hypothetical protein